MPICKKCNNRFPNRIKIDGNIVEYKGGKCVQCGYNKNMKALVFHHINPNEKEFSLSGCHCISWKRIKKELDKCILLCANCHIEEHDNVVV